MAGNKVKILVDAVTDGAKKSIDQLENNVSKLGSAAVAAGKVAAAGFATLAAGVGVVGKQALDAYADYEQLVGGVDKLYGESSGKLQQYAAQAYATSGLSANKYMEQATSFSASLISSLGGDTNAAADLTNTAMQSMADNVNVFGSNMEDVQNAFQGFAKQNYTMLDNLKLGYSGTQSEMQRLIADSAALTKEQEDLGFTVDASSMSFDNIVKAIAVMQEHMGIAGTTGKEAMDTISGSITMAQASWENLLVGFADENADLGQLTDQFLESIGAVAENVAPRVAQIGQGIIDALPEALSGIGDVLAPVLSEALATAWNIAVSALSGLGINLPEIDSEQILTAIQSLCDAFCDFAEVAAPIVSTVINGIIDVLTWLSENIDTLMPFITGLVAAFVAFQAASAIVGIISALITALSFLFSPIGLVVGAITLIVAAFTAWNNNMFGVRDTIMGVFTAIGTFFTEFVNNVIGFFTGIWEWLTGTYWPWLLSIPGQIWGLLLSVITNVGTFVANMASSALSAGSQFLSNIVTNLTELPSRVWGFLLDVIGKVSNFVTDMATGAADAARDFGDKLIEGVTKIPEQVGKIGKQIVDGIADGITGAAGAAVDAITGVFGGAIDAAKNFLGIASPSKKFKREVGRMIPLGAAQGIEDEAQSYYDAVEDVFSYSPDIAYDATIGAGQVSAAQSAAAVYQTINFNQPVQTPAEMARAMRMQNMYGLAGA